MDLGWFHILDIMNNAAISLDVYLVVGLLNEVQILN
jgi:hypothetical protein